MAAVAADIATFLKAQREVHPDAADEYARMEELYTRKLWHQLTLAIAAFVAQPRLQGTDGTELAHLYENFIRHFEAKMNALALAKMVIAIARFFPNERATMFVNSLIAKVGADAEAVTLCKTEVARLKLKAGDTAGCKELLDEAQVTVDLMAGMDTEIHISFYTTLAQYYKVPAHTPDASTHPAAAVRARPLPSWSRSSG
jgi:26S proteasome regulatory subunit N9